MFVALEAYCFQLDDIVELAKMDFNYRLQQLGEICRNGTLTLSELGVVQCLETLTAHAWHGNLHNMFAHKTVRFNMEWVWSSFADGDWGVDAEIRD